MKKNYIHMVLIVALLVLLALWLRENEMKVAAQSKLTNLEFKATSVINEKGEAIADLSTQVGEMQAHLQQTTEEAATALADRDMQILKMEEEARVAQEEHESAIALMQKEMEETSEKYDTSLKKKNTELSELGEELRKTTERLAASLKEKEKTESENFDLKQEVASLGRRIAKLNEDNRHLEALAKIGEAPPTADSVAGR